MIREVSGEVIVYDADRHVAHCLNPAAARVFQKADGETSVAELASLLRHDLGAPADERWVALALAGLRRAHLLAEDPALPPPPNASRRLLLRRIGLGAALLLPVVTSLVVPTPAEAVATCVTDCTGQEVGTQCSLIGDSSDCDQHACDGLGNCI